MDKFSIKRLGRKLADVSLSSYDILIGGNRGKLLYDVLIGGNLLKKLFYPHKILARHVYLLYRVSQNTRPAFEWLLLPEHISSDILQYLIE